MIVLLPLLLPLVLVRQVSVAARPGFGGGVNDGAYDFHFDRV